MLNFNCLIIEDEPLAAEVLTDYVKMVHFLTLKGVCSDAVYAMELLSSEAIDLIFLDIHLPKLKGLEFLRSLKNPPNIIVTSAYKEYALEAFDLNVVDYLLKPIRFNRFIKAVDKLSMPSQKYLLDTTREPTTERHFLFFNVGAKRVKLFTDEILFIESFRESIKINAKEQTILTRFPIGETEKLLPPGKFLRIHRSYIVAIDKISAYSRNDIEVGQKELPMGRNYKEHVLDFLDNKSKLQF
ncbi:MAG: LytR/AlgR family response regulator transcription factor [Mucilaginibacter sp.]